MTPIALGISSILIAVIVFGGRRLATLSLLAGVLFLSQLAHLDLAGINVFPMRLLGAVAFSRVLLRGEFTQRNANRLDRAVVTTYVFIAVVAIGRSLITGGAGLATTQFSVTDQIGNLADTLFIYFAFRGLLKDREDLTRVLSGLAVMLVPYVALLMVERTTGNSPFAAVGGWARIDLYDVRVRCVGSFKHPALLGSFGASFFPLFLALSIWPKTRPIGFLGSGACLAVVLLAHAGGPVSMLLVGIGGWLLWPLRRDTRRIRYWILTGLCLSSIAMRGPPWWLMEKASRVFGLGGDGWHRAEVVNIAVDHISQWWLIGMPLALTHDWFPYRIGGAADITNYYVAIGLDSGLFGIVLFIVLLTRAYRQTGYAIAGSISSENGSAALMAWAVGVTLTTHVVNFFAITYFDQMYAVFAFHIAAVSAIAHGRGKSPNRVQARPSANRWLRTQPRRAAQGKRGMV